MLLAAGVPMQVVSDVLGHASESFTSDGYAVVARRGRGNEDCGVRATAEPRIGRSCHQRARNSPGMTKGAHANA
nr:hypothetical protein [Actinomadura sp. KC216]